MGTETADDGVVQLPGSFDAFYRAEYPGVAALVYSLTGKADVADDLAQESFLRAHRDWSTVALRRHPEYWVRRVAVNLAISRFRRLGAETRALLRLGPAGTSIDTPLQPEYEAFWAIVRRLPNRQRQVVALHYVHEMSVAEIATALEIAEGTVKATLHQARANLERELRSSGWWV